MTSELKEAILRSLPDDGPTIGNAPLRSEVAKDLSSDVSEAECATRLCPSLRVAPDA
jgi:hypothetical protein